MMANTSHKSNPMALGKIIVASNPSAETSSPCPMHTGSVFTFTWAEGEDVLNAAEPDGVAEVVTTD
jgi:hypothetical protein